MDVSVLDHANVQNTKPVELFDWTSAVRKCVALTRKRHQFKLVGVFKNLAVIRRYAFVQQYIAIFAPGASGKRKNC